MRERHRLGRDGIERVSDSDRDILWRDSERWAEKERDRMRETDGE